MKKAILSLTVVSVLSAGAAFADVTLINKDSKSHDIAIKCTSGSTTQTSIGSNVTRSIGNGPCTVTDKTSGATHSAADGETITIKAGS